MVKIEFLKEIKIDKNPEIVEDFINLYWKIFIDKNKKSKELIFVKRSEIIKNSKYSRRNCYKHLRHLLLKNIFIEDKNYFIPSSLIYKINKKMLNPTEIIFNTKINQEILNKGIINIKPSIDTEKIREFSKLIKIGNNDLYNFISISWDIGDKISFSQSFKIHNLPKMKTIIGIWNQRDKEIKEKEITLFKVLNPNKDPFNHNGFIELRGDFSPLLELEKGIKTYVIAGWASRFWDKEKDIGIIGDYFNKEDAGTELLFYDKNKNLLYKKKLVFPSSEQGIPIADMSSFIFTKKNYKENKNSDYIGYYDFKNDNSDLQHILNHLIIHFSKFKVSDNIKFIRFSTENNAFFNLINIFPLNKLDINFIKERAANIDNGKFIQDEFPPIKDYKIKSIDTSKFNKINIIIKKAGYEYGRKKQVILQNAINKIIDYSYSIRNHALQSIKENKEMEKTVKMILAINDTIGYMGYCLIKCPEELSKKIDKAIIYNINFFEKIIPLLENKITSASLGSLLQTRFAEPLILFEKKDLPKLDKKIEDSLLKIELIKDPFNKIRISDELKKVIKQKIEKDFLSEKTKNYVEYLIKVNNLKTKNFNELALKTIDCEDKKKFNKEYIINKYKIYESLAIYYQYQNILYKLEYYEKISEDKERFNELKLMLEEFKNKIL
ncbi:MAG: hypothetical protein AABX54_02260 [Nanoarchaeota archaeon]